MSTVLVCSVLQYLISKNQSRYVVAIPSNIFDWFISKLDYFVVKIPGYWLHKDYHLRIASHFNNCDDICKWIEILMKRFWDHFHSDCIIHSSWTCPMARNIWFLHWTTLIYNKNSMTCYVYFFILDPFFLVLDFSSLKLTNVNLLDRKWKCIACNFLGRSSISNIHYISKGVFVSLDLNAFQFKNLFLFYSIFYSSLQVSLLNISLMTSLFPMKTWNEVNTRRS